MSDANYKAGQDFAKAMQELASHGLSEEETLKRVKAMGLGKLHTKHTGFLSPNAPGPHLPHLK